MKRRSWMMAACLTAMTAVAGLASVKTDYDHAAHFERYRTFAWRTPRPGSAIVQNSLLDSRVKNDVTRELAARGMKEDTHGPDVYVTYHANARTYREVGYFGGWRRPYWGGPGMLYQYVEGSIVLDVVDAHTGQLVWRAYMDNTGSDLADVQSEKTVAKLVTQAFKQFPVGLRKPA